METIGIVGTGTMGTGIAQVAAQQGCKVRLLDAEPARVEGAVAQVAKRLARLVEKGRLPADEADRARKRLLPAEGPTDFRDCGAVIEAVVEDLEVKVQVFRDLLAHLADEAFLATNTSSLSVSTLGERAGAPARVVGMHFFNPVPLMPLVEIVAGRATDPAVVERAAALARSWRKTVVHAQDTPGFIVNRVARGFYLEPVRMLGEGVAGVDAMDTALRTLGGFRLGPFELMDLIGIDVNYTVSVSVWEQLGRPVRLAPHPLQKERVKRGKLGRKSGEGWYRYGADTPVPAVVVPTRTLDLSPPLREAVDAFCARAAAREGSPAERYVFARTLVTIMNEAARLEAEGGAARADIDTAMKTGTNYPEGPLAWAARVGYDTCRRLLAALDAAAGDGRFAPAGVLGG